MSFDSPASRDAGRLDGARLGDASHDAEGSEAGGPDGSVLCGNGRVDPGEACDDGAANSDAKPDACRLNCMRAGCGDNVVDSGEVCDGTAFAGATCSDYGYSAGTLTCSSDCARITVDTCTNCGDGVCAAEQGETAGSCPVDCGWVDVAVGAGHICGVTGDGRLWCWGKSEEGQLGLGDTSDGHDRPTEVDFFPDAGMRVARVRAGYYFTCAISDGGLVYCWGANRRGQLGPDAPIGPYHPSPVLVSPLADLGPVADLGLGHKHVCALLNGDVWCWGSNDWGQLGQGTSDASKLPHPDPVRVEMGASVITGIAAGESHTCGWTKVLGLVWCWGAPEKGGIGNAQHWGDLGPHLVAALPFAGCGVAAGLAVSCARSTDDDSLWCWGNNAFGLLGDGQEHNEASACEDCSFSPVRVSIVAPVQDAVLGRLHGCAIQSGGVVSCWGDNRLAAVGWTLGSEAVSPPVPVNIPGLASKLAAGPGNTCVIDEQARLWCWGDNQYGQLGDGVANHDTCILDSVSHDCSVSPVQVPAPTVPMAR